jgi:hypothetical protein
MTVETRIIDKRASTCVFTDVIVRRELNVASLFWNMHQLFSYPLCSLLSVWSQRLVANQSCFQLANIYDQKGKADFYTTHTRTRAHAHTHTHIWKENRLQSINIVGVTNHGILISFCDIYICNIYMYYLFLLYGNVW